MSEDIQESADISQEINVEQAEPQVDNIRDDIVKAVAEAKERDDKGRFAPKEKLNLPPEAKEKAEKKVQEATAPEEKPEVVAPPASWKAEHKEKWSEIPPHMQKAILAREEEIHKGFTRLDEERLLGKQIKETVAPYLAQIQAEGGTPITAVKDLLNTAYVLRTGDPVTKARLVAQVIQQYGVDLSLAGQQAQNVDPVLAQTQQRLMQLEQQLRQEKELQSQQQNASIMTEIEAFSNNPENSYFEQVRADMQTLLQSGAIPAASPQKMLKEAYDRAVWANPTTRQLLLVKQAAEAESKRNEVVATKKRASGSITGSSGTTNANPAPKDRSLADEIRANYRAAVSSDA